MTDSYPRKYWWLVLVILPIILSLVAVIPNFIGSSPNESSNSISIHDATVGGDVQIIGTQVIFKQMETSGIKPEAAQDLKASITRAINLVKGGFAADAIPIFESIAAQTQSPAVYHNLGTLYLHNNQDSEALNAFKQGLSINPDYEPIHTGIARLYKQQGKVREAIDELEKAPNDKAAAKLVQTWQKDIAGDHFEQEPNNDILHPNLANLPIKIRGVLDSRKDVDFFSFTIPGAPRDIYAITNKCLSTSLMLKLELLGSDKQHIWKQYADTAGQDIHRSFSPKVNTTYYVSISSRQGYGSYQLEIYPRKAFDEFEPNDSIFQAAETDSGKSIDANLMDRKDIDFYRVTSVGSSLSAKIINRSSDLVLLLKLWRDDKKLLWSSGTHHNAGQDLEKSLPTKPNKNYFVSVSSRSGSGPYRLTVTQND